MSLFLLLNTKKKNVGNQAVADNHRYYESQWLPDMVQFSHIFFYKVWSDVIKQRLSKDVLRNSYEKIQNQGHLRWTGTVALIYVMHNKFYQW